MPESASPPAPKVLVVTPLQYEKRAHVRKATVPSYKYPRKSVFSPLTQIAAFSS